MTVKAQKPKRKPASAAERILLRRKAIDAAEALRLKRKDEER